MAINYSGCTVQTSPVGTITAENGMIYKYDLRKARRWNIGLRRHVLELTGEITVFYPATQKGRLVSSMHYPTWDEACADVAKYSLVDAR